MQSQQEVNIEHLWEQWRHDENLEAYHQLVNYYIGIVDQIVLKMQPSISDQVTYDELRSHGMIGFLDALKKFDYQKGYQFETYASLRIRGSILDGLRQTDWIPRSIREKAKKIQRAYQELEQKYLRSVTDKEVSEYLHLSLEAFYQQLKETSFLHCLSLDEPIDFEQETTRATRLEDPRQNLDAKISREFVRDVLAKSIDRLPEKEKLVITLYYYEELNITEISEILGLSPSRISQLHTKAIYRLRGSLGRMKNQLF
ncbi:FliA/WhiG family RNA polymerase sigma factor [Tepidibacillus fermentans]|uniref:RNA polymerase sigma factor for flagellar operon FliA n=1 Tax=Tepidibacillus fermentans TaxID=1281767 RepID=A0A4R3KIG2_9BACI|nr:FliA/WhiG family RNA polymerase sigma factor [Tepidibacillus fermentans]TCS82964.1 RNA polymerase sigma factor for flagellar operon FliA [Tepidibacillus fermentans]